MTDQRQNTPPQRPNAVTDRGYRPVQALFSAENVLAYLLLGLALATMLTFTPGRQPSLEFLGLAALLIEWIIALSLGLLYLFRNRLGRKSLGFVLLAMTGSITLVTWLSGIVGWVLLVGAQTTGLALFFVQITAIAWTMAAAGAALVFHGVRWHRLKLQLERAELEALQARVRPHFLFNALNTATALLPGKPVDAEKVLLDLGDLFRAALHSEQAHWLDEELALTRRYLDIETLRLGSRLRLTWSTPDCVPAIRVPTFCVQALAENAIQHGIEPAHEGGWVDLRLIAHANRVEIHVRNSIPTADAAQPRAAGKRIGVGGTRTRVKALLGPEAALEIGHTDGAHFATLRLPFHPTTR